MDLIEKDAHITQREISKAIGVAVSMVNSYLDDYEKKGLIKRKKYSTKTVEYFVTKKGMERRKVLNIGYLNASQLLYNSAKENIEQFLKQIENRGFKNILLYGAGEVAEILLHAINSSKTIAINTIAIIDDNFEKQGLELTNTKIISINEISKYSFDCILVSSYTNRININSKLDQLGIPLTSRIQFFE